MKALVTGSLECISKPLAKKLIRRSHLVTVVGTRLEQQKDIEALGVIAA